MTKKSLLSRISLVGLVASFLLVVACGGGGGSNSVTSPTTTAASQTSSITIGDAPADAVVAYEVTISSVSLTGSAGSVTAISSPRRLEMTHLSATVESLALLNIPNGTYTQATISWSRPEVTFLDGAGALHEVESAASGTATVPISLIISGASVLNFDLDVAASVTVNTAAGTAVFAANPAFTLSAARGMGEVEREPETGELEHIVGSVISATATSLTISVGESGTNMTFVINASTQLEGISSTSQLVANQVVRVEGNTQTDGTMVAKEVEAESADGRGMEAEGLVTSITGSTFTMIAHNSSGQSTTSADLGRTITVDATTARFSIGKTKINTGAFAFAALADLHKGQRVEADSDTPKSAGAGTVNDDGTMSGVKKIKLVQQALRGTVSGASSGSFTLTVPADSAFAKLAGVTTLQVVNNGAQMKNGAAITNGATLRVRGLLFADASGYHLVAGRITTP